MRNMPSVCDGNGFEFVCVERRDIDTGYLVVETLLLIHLSYEPSYDAGMPSPPLHNGHFVIAMYRRSRNNRLSG